MTAIPTTTPPLAAARRVSRIEVRPAAGEPDPVAAAAQDTARQYFGHAVSLRSAHIFLIESPLTDAQLRQVADELLADPVSQTAHIGASPVHDDDDAAPATLVEVHYQPGVMDPVAQSTRDAIVEMLPELCADDIEVRTGTRYDIRGSDAPADAVTRFAAAALANPVIQDIHLTPYHPDAFAHGQPYSLHITHVPIRELDDAGLKKLSREGHLFLSLDEMRAVQSYYRDAQREPTDIELETLAQTWSEHCVHKTLKSQVRYVQADGDAKPSPRDWANRPGHSVQSDGSLRIDNLLKSTIAAATRKLMETEPHNDWCISVFVDNAGIVRFDEDDAVCIKVETHNHPSAIEPYGGAATGIGGCIRDIMGTGLSATPIANTDSFCVASPTLTAADVPKGVIHPRRVLQQVVAGVRDYGNRMGIPTVNGQVYFHDNYLGNPLVFAGCVGLIPADKCFGDAKPGDRIIALGGATGRDGIHGATFSSAELTDTHADEFSHAVQIGNAITQKKTMDVILQARDAEGGPMFRAITDCGAGGFSSAVGEMGEKVGAHVHLERAPLKYAGLSYTEIWISEAQERMVLAVPPDQVDRLRAMCDAENVMMCDLGAFGVTDDAGQPQLVLTYHDTQVGKLSMHLLHEGIPTPTREAQWSPPSHAPKPAAAHSEPAVGEALLSLLSHPNIASKHWIIRQYDHEVQGGSVVKPLVGPQQDGPGDAAVIRPKLHSDRAIAIACGMQPGIGETTPGGDSYWAALAGIDETVRNLICVGADPSHIAILDNFCWPSCDDPRNLGSLVRAAEACYDGALAYRTPFVSGKDSLNNQFTTDDGSVIAIPPTLLISGLAIVPDCKRARTMDAKAPGNLLLIVGRTTSALGGSHYAMRFGCQSRDSSIPHVDLTAGPANAAAVAALTAKGLVQSAHDCSDGGLAVAAAEMAFAGRIGVDLDLEGLPADRATDERTACFAETASRYLLEVMPGDFHAVAAALRAADVPFGQVGAFAAHDRMTIRSPRAGQLMDITLDALHAAWRKPLDW